MRFKSSVVRILLVLIPLATVLIVYYSYQQIITGLEEFMFESLAGGLPKDEQGYICPDDAEGVSIAHIQEVDCHTNTVSAFRIWTCREGRIVENDLNALTVARCSRERSDWPPSLILFRFDSMSPLSSQVEVSQYYYRGLSTASRGGNTEEWYLERDYFGHWELVNKKIVAFWD